MTTAEAGDEARFAGELIKLLTGGDTVQARALYSNPIQFRPMAKMVWVTNALPRLNDRDRALWARIQAVPFRVVYEADRIDRELPEKLFREAPGVLAWAVRGCLAWQREGLRPPAAVTSETRRYRETLCPVRQFLAAACEPAPNNFIVASEMLKRFKDKPHALRHTFAVWHLERGADPRWVQQQMGHTSIQETVDTYGSWIAERHDQNAAEMDRLLGQ